LTSDQEPGSAADLRRAGLQWRLDPEDRPGDLACLLPPGLRGLRHRGRVRPADDLPAMRR